MSKLFGLARAASEYLRNRMRPSVRAADESVEETAGGARGYLDRRPGLRRSMREILTDSKKPRSRGLPDKIDIPQEDDRRPGAPPIDPDEVRRRSQAGVAPPRPPRPKAPAEEEFDQIELIGRDAGYDKDDFEAVMTAMRRTPGSSNVYGYYFEREARRTGILYVTFLYDYRGQKGNGPGPTYAYYDVPVKKAVEFQRASETSAGGAVWDYLRVRGSIHAHQHQYRLVHAHGEYVPRKATAGGFRTRHLLSIGSDKRRSYRRSTLPEQRFFSRGGPNRGEPNRGTPDRGEPDRG